MTKKNQFEKRVKELQELFGLINWTILIRWNSKPDVKQEGKYADLVETGKMKADCEYQIVEMVFSTHLLTLSKKEWNYTIVHELLHTLMAEHDGYIEANTDLKDDLFWKRYREILTVNLEKIICRIL